MVNDSYTHEEFLSIKEFALLLKVHSNTIRRAIKKGRISAFKVGSGKKAIYRICKSEINRIALLDLEEIMEKLLEKKLRNINSKSILV